MVGNSEVFAVGWNCFEKSFEIYVNEEVPMLDVIIIGAGPCGLSAAIECQRRGLQVLVLEKHCLVHSIYSYPTYMQFLVRPNCWKSGMSLCVGK